MKPRHTYHDVHELCDLPHIRPPVVSASCLILIQILHARVVFPGFYALLVLYQSNPSFP